jgi:hypothetical protein
LFEESEAVAPFIEETQELRPLLEDEMTEFLGILGVDSPTGTEN